VDRLWLQPHLDGHAVCHQSTDHRIRPAEPVRSDLGIIAGGTRLPRTSSDDQPKVRSAAAFQRVTR